MTMANLSHVTHCGLPAIDRVSEEQGRSRP